MDEPVKCISQVQHDSKNKTVNAVFVLMNPPEVLAMKSQTRANLAQPTA
jgi:hypothetical protein